MLMSAQSMASLCSFPKYICMSFIAVAPNTIGLVYPIACVVPPTNLGSFWLFGYRTCGDTTFRSYQQRLGGRAPVLLILHLSRQARDVLAGIAKRFQPSAGQDNRIIERAIPCAIRHAPANHAACAPREQSGGAFLHSTPSDRAIPGSRLRCALANNRATRFRMPCVRPRNLPRCHGGGRADDYLDRNRRTIATDLPTPGDARPLGNRADAHALKVDVPAVRPFIDTFAGEGRHAPMIPPIRRRGKPLGLGPLAHAS